MKRRQLEKHLREHQCEFLRHGSRHDYWVNTTNGQRAPIPRHNEIKRTTAQAICKQLGVPDPT